MISDFKKCSDSEFCMKLKSSKSHFEVTDKTILKPDGSYELVIAFKGQSFLVDIYLIDSGIVNFHVKDPKPSQTSNRYRLVHGEILPKDSLLGLPRDADLENNDMLDSIKFKNGSDNLNIVIHHYPFFVEIFQNERPVLEINTASMLYIEENDPDIETTKGKLFS